MGRPQFTLRVALYVVLGIFATQGMALAQSGGAPAGMPADPAAPVASEGLSANTPPASAFAQDSWEFYNLDTMSGSSGLREIPGSFDSQLGPGIDPWGIGPIAVPLPTAPRLAAILLLVIGGMTVLRRRRFRHRTF